MTKKESQPKGKRYGIRQGQLFGPWGVGAILPCPDGSSVMIAGLDAFPYNGDRMRSVYDKRLTRYIGAKRLLAPPIGAETVPAVRFPHWLYCPSCKRVYYCKNNQQANLYCTNESCDSKRRLLVPERFVVVCPEGHIDDLPILEWVHGGRVSNPEGHVMQRTTKGGSASLGDIEYKCITCGKSRSLKGITRPSALHECGYTCKGGMPWLDQWNSTCTADPESLAVVQRGGTNVWYSDVVSSIYIPETVDAELGAFVQKNHDKLKKYAGRGEEQLDEFIEDSLVEKCKYTASEIKAVFFDLESEESASDQTESDYREAEYRTLKQASESNRQKGTFEGKRIDVREYESSLIRSMIESVTLVTTLKETRALVGFTRLYPDGNEEKKFRDRRKMLSVEPLDWTLGMQATGEGIFLAFKRDVLNQWRQSRSARRRFEKMKRNFNRSNKERDRDPRELNPEYALIHTLSHVLMLGLTKECGYSTASVKERIYCDKFLAEDDRHEDMLGLLVYTASDDSEGSLGGLVRAGRPGRFERIFDNALRSACWCSSDPVCIESPGQGPGSCNLAACYSCALVPETSCETGNRFIDRALLVGTLSNPETGLLGKALRGEGMPIPMTAQKASEPQKDDYEVVFEDYDLSDEDFGGVCEFALYDADEEEGVFIDQLVKRGIELSLQKPAVDASFAKGGAEAVASLVWADSRVVFLLRRAADEFRQSFGDEYSSSSSWKFVTIDDLGTPDKLVELLGALD
ncbi:MULTISPECIES: DUF1998 domain-containing protein [unclassified Adlercreutzia]|uniref:DUF1998 domain-containing protein n=1 Tax=unclassified Adlercreutzia TaxID=2636013 RepID=UPI0013EB6182|nr:MULTISPECIES: DUF1998 domain-containing protein [unclassified Adlercreutzia]